MDIRHATNEDISAIAFVESLCFPAAEAATISSITDRVNTYPMHFWLCFVDGVLVSFVNGLCTNSKDLTDDMFESAAIHDENGEWQMIFSVCTHPSYTGKGFASATLERAISDCRSDKRKGVVLTCKEALLPFYARFGFINEGVSKSEHGGARWYQMRLTF